MISNKRIKIKKSRHSRVLLSGLNLLKQIWTALGWPAGRNTWMYFVIQWLC